MPVLTQLVKKRVQLIVHAAIRCDSCGNLIERVEPSLSDPTFQGERALVIRLFGGYGMYFDDLNTIVPRIILCRECADKLCGAFPVFKKALDQGWSDVVNEEIYAKDRDDAASGRQTSVNRDSGTERNRKNGKRKAS